MGFLCTFVVVPFGGSLIVADLDIGILYILAVTSLVVVGILMAGWASNNKWSLLGGMRSAAQIVSYEIPAGMAILTVVFLAGTMSMQGIIKAQGWGPWDWFCSQPVYLLSFLVFPAAGGRQPHTDILKRNWTGRRLCHREHACGFCFSSLPNGATYVIGCGDHFLVAACRHGSRDVSALWQSLTIRFS
jgi:hypothetical protein